ncbi:rhomboid family intramembrane serine protease [Desulfosarcina sp.]|uniref:rhomboid family intramembrane serine protease n=1 Tax=Desulfosarcina sp. TaxID=2027861 RepID=UPI00397082DA
MPVLLEKLSKEEAQTFGLVLLSSGIDHQAAKGAGGWVIRVNDDDAAPAAELIRVYLHENRSFHPLRKRAVVEYPRTFSGLWGALVIISVHVAVVSGRDAGSFAEAYGSSARHILSGEWYRCATSLLLHADVVHLLGNSVGIAVFGTAVCSVMGWGVGWLMLLASGMLGNLANAWFYQTGHLSIGASTTVFGAVGVLSAYQFIHKIKVRGERYQAFLPIAAGMALLAFLGAARHSDIMGHLFGFMSGLALGMIYCFFVKQSLRWSYQIGALLLAAAVLGGAWLFPIISGA